MEDKKELVIEYNITLGCPMCGHSNTTLYIPHHKETFVCSRCGQQNMIVMSFVAVVDNPPGVRTMMLDSKKFGKRINRNIGGVVSGSKAVEGADSGTI